MAEQQPPEESDWQGVENTVSDEEEARVIFCSLDSFLWVPPHRQFTWHCVWSHFFASNVLYFTYSCPKIVCFHGGVRSRRELEVDVT